MLLAFAITFFLDHHDTLAALFPVTESLHAASEASVFILVDSLATPITGIRGTI